MNNSLQIPLKRYAALINQLCNHFHRPIGLHKLRLNHQAVIRAKLLSKQGALLIAVKTCAISEQYQASLLPNIGETAGRITVYVLPLRQCAPHIAYVNRLLGSSIYIRIFRCAVILAKPARKGGAIGHFLRDHCL